MMFFGQARQMPLTSVVGEHTSAVGRQEYRILAASKALMIHGRIFAPLSMERERLVHHFIPGASDRPPMTALGVAARRSGCQWSGRGGALFRFGTNEALDIARGRNALMTSGTSRRSQSF